MMETKDRVCPVALAGGLDNRVRRWFQNPRRVLGPYIREGMTVLDFGCGPGFFSLDLASMVGPSGRVIAADLQEGMLRKLRAKSDGTELEARITVHQCEKDRLGVSLHVDFALAFWVIHELPDQRAFFAEIKTILNPQGRLLVVEPPIHVSRKAFEASIGLAEIEGFAVMERPHVRFSRAALLELSATV